MKNKRLLRVLICINAFLIIALIPLYIIKENKTSYKEQISSYGAVSKNPNSIAIPGYETLIFRADDTKQTVCFENPPQNCCYFEITLSLANGTVLWVSDYIAPGDISLPVVLNAPLPAGTYTEAKLIYQCFQMNEDFTPLNGAETKLTLVVK